MNANKVDILCDQIVDAALVVKEAKDVISNANFVNSYPQKFINRIDSVLQYCYTLFINANKHTDNEITDLMINLMNGLVGYKNSYRSTSYGYKVMNSLLDIVKSTFVELN